MLKKLRYLTIIKSFLVVFILVGISSFFLGSRIDPDMWWHIRLGNNILNGIWVNNLTFTCTEYTWINHSWLTDVLFSIFNSTFGIQGLSLIFAVIILVGIYFNWLTLRLIASKLSLSLNKYVGLSFLTLYALVLAPFIAIRPQVVTFLFLSIFLYLLFNIYYSKAFSIKKSLLLIPFFILWVNLHGGFLIGFVVLGVFLVDGIISFVKYLGQSNKVGLKDLPKKIYNYFFLMGLLLIASFINPFGVTAWQEVVNQIFGSNNAKYIAEWAAINIKSLNQFPFFILSALGVVLMIFNKKGYSIRLLLLCIFSFLGFYSVRYMLPASLIVVLILFVEALIFFKLYLENFVRSEISKRQINFLKFVFILMALLIGLVGIFNAGRFIQGTQDLYNKESLALSLYPVGAGNHLLENRDLYKDYYFFNTYVWGGYLEYFLPELNWFIDGRMPEWRCQNQPLVKESLMLDYIELETIKADWQKVIEVHNINAFIIKTDSPFANLLQSNSDWRITYSDDMATIFIKE